ncbi:NIPSNAP family protein [Marinobacterium aestuariivivens]|uniref:NIPSNAP family protein n=1 Tax=Marinobacterium aestuariivivens TaxID=1698799 RepID=A0ABW2A7F8_9GAMM
MKRYEIATLTTKLFTAGKVAEGVKSFCEAPEAEGRLLGCWFSDIGDLNKVMVLRGFDSSEAMERERERTRRSDNPFHCSEYLIDMALDSYAPFPFLPPVEVGDFGPIYELRTYQLKQGGLAPTIDAWSKAVPERIRFSPLCIALYALDGSQRITQIWPYRSLEERTRARSESVQAGAWPPKGGPDWLTTDMTSAIYLPTAVSPLR